MENFETINPNWNLVDPLTIHQAAALMAGFDPNAVIFNADIAAWFENETGLTTSGGIRCVQTTFVALTNAINARKLKARLRFDAEPRYEAGRDNLHERGYWGGEDVLEIKDFADDGSYVITKNPNWNTSTVTLDDVRAWLDSMNSKPAFFFPIDTAKNTTDYMYKKHPRYSAKLAAAVKVWQAMEDESLLRAKPIIEAKEGWLETNYQRLGLVWKDKINKTAIQECAKIANWKTDGGATKTPE
jgi:hypothetical protein